jgi:predicted membrane protein
MHEPGARHVRLTPQAILGICVILYGLLLTAANLGLLDIRRVLAYWPLILIVLGSTVYRRAPDRGGRISGGLIIAAGTLLTAARLFGWHLSISLLGPLAIIAVGVVIVLRAVGAGAPGLGLGDQQVSSMAIWSGNKRVITSPLFQHADFTALMGGIEVDLRAAGMPAGEAVMDVFILMGGMEIRVPPDWSVSNQLVAFMAGVEDRTTGAATATHRLVLRGFVMMGGVEVKT